MSESVPNGYIPESEVPVRRERNPVLKPLLPTLDAMPPGAAFEVPQEIIKQCPPGRPENNFRLYLNKHRPNKFLVTAARGRIFITHRKST